MKITTKLQNRYDQLNNAVNKEKVILRGDIERQNKNIENLTATLQKCLETAGASEEYVKCRRSIEDSKLIIEADEKRLDYIENSANISEEEVNDLELELLKESKAVYTKARVQIQKLLEQIETITKNAEQEIKEGNDVMKAVCIDLYGVEKNEAWRHVSKGEEYLAIFRRRISYAAEWIEPENKFR